VTALYHLPPLPSHVGPLLDDDATRVDSTICRDYRSPAQCPLCHLSKIFRWYRYSSQEWRGSRDHNDDVVEYECPCVDQWVLCRFFAASGLLLKQQRASMMDIYRPEALHVYSEYSSGFRKYIESGAGLLLQGTNGSGKTLVATLLLKEALRNGYSGFFLTFADMIEASRIRGYGQEDKQAFFRERIKSSRVLVVDDVGHEMRQGYSSDIANISKSLIDEVLRFRVGMAYTTIITSNMYENDLTKAYGKGIYSLLQESSMVRTLAGEDARTDMRTRFLDEVSNGLVRPIQFPTP
jgi:DNA replication protein DnaC